MMRNPATTHTHTCTCVPADADQHDFARAVGHAETAALNAVRAQANHAPPTTPAANHATLVVCDPSLAEWLTYDGRARRDRFDHVCLDPRPLRQLPDIVEGGAPALEVYLHAFAAALTHAGFGVHVITHTTTRARRQGAPAREPPDAAQLSAEVGS